MLLTLPQALALLKKYEIPVCRQELVSTKTQLLEKTRSLDYPLVLKAFTEQHSHKTEAGLVYLDLHDEKELLAAFSELNCKTSGLHAGFLVQEYLPGVEFIIGGKKDEVFGQTILFGSGGVLAELLDDVSVRVTPISAGQAREMISETKAHLFFTPRGFRGKKVSERKIVGLLLAVSRLLEEHPEITELDLNPVLADERSVWVADARVIVTLNERKAEIQ